MASAVFVPAVMCNLFH